MNYKSTHRILVGLLIAVPLSAQVEFSTAQFSPAHPRGPAEGGPISLVGSMSWAEDGTSGKAGFRYMATPGKSTWGEEYLDATKALARNRRLAKPGFEVEFIPLSGQPLRLECMGVTWGKIGSALVVDMESYQPGKGFRLFRNGVLLCEKFFDPQPLPPIFEVKELSPDRIEWRIQRSPQLEQYSVRVSWDEGQTWLMASPKDNHMILNLEESRRNPGIQPWIEFQIAQGFVMTVKRYVMGKGFNP